MERLVKTEKLEPKITESHRYNSGYTLLAIFITFVFIGLGVLFYYLLDFNREYYLLSVIGLVTFYAVFLFFLLEPRIMREANNVTIQTVEKEVPVEKEVIKEVVKEVPVEKEIVKEAPVEKKIFIDRIKEVPVEKKVFVDRPVEKTVFVPTPKKPSIPQPEFVASTETWTYHRKSCRLGKLIKKKNRFSTDIESEFIGKGLKPCKVCVLKIKKV